MWVFPGGIPLSFVLSQQVYNLLEVKFLHQFLELPTILHLFQIIGLVYLLPAVGYPFPSNIYCLVLHSHHIHIEHLHYIYESKSFVLTKKMPTLAFNNFLQEGDPLPETSFAYEISVLQFIPPGEISHL